MFIISKLYDDEFLVNEFLVNEAKDQFRRLQPDYCAGDHD